MKYVYSFNEGTKDMRDILGGKGANLCEMVNIGLPVPKGFIISTSACIDYYDHNLEINEEVVSEIYDKLSVLEKESGKVFGDSSNPLLVSVRSGARSSMPGMMDTILNLGLNDEIVEALCKTRDERFILDCYRRFISMYSDVVMGYDKSKFEDKIDEIKKRKGIKYDIDLDSSDMRELVSCFKDIYRELSGEDFPSDPRVQLIEAVKAVFRSWNNERAKFYRKMNNIPDNWGTAVNVQEMVYGNLNESSGTGVVFSRNPANGDNELYGEYLMNAQGEDIVAGVRTPLSIDTLKDVNSKCYEELLSNVRKLERHYKDMQDMEFTIEDNKLYMLPTRSGKRTGKAAIKIAVSLVNEGIIDEKEAISRISTKDIDSMLHPMFDEDKVKEAVIVTKGLAASPGAGSGKVYFNADEVKKAYDDGERDIILARLETSPEDIEGMNLSKAVITIRGGMTSHAAVVARGMGIPCVSGCENLIISEKDRTITYNGKVITSNDYISVDGTSGMVYLGNIPTHDAAIEDYFKEFMTYVTNNMSVGVRANADNEKDAMMAFKLGAKGIGLCRTEHMFFDEERIFNFRKMILAKDKKDREEALEKILPYQRDDFYHLFKVMDGFPVTIRLLDPPLHEFLPKTSAEIKELADSLNLDVSVINDRISELKEFNPMMGHRGCRLAITYPEIAEMQARAIALAFVKAKEEGVDVKPEIMVPLVGEDTELKYVKDIIVSTTKKITDYDFMIGTMIEVPRGAILADKIGKYADFFSFGTNDLTQMTFGFSRDDAGKFLNDYYEKGILSFNPFQKIDKDGVGYLIKEAIKKGKEVNNNIELGICGEQGADEDSIMFLKEVGVDYVSCSPYRVPCAMLASAKANIIK